MSSSAPARIWQHVGRFLRLLSTIGKFGVVAFAVGYIWFASCQDLAAWRETAARKIGDEVVRALETYRKDHGGYPQNLDALIPNYIEDIGSYEWHYGYDKDTYQLFFQVKHGPFYNLWRFDSRNKKWQIVDQSF